MRLLLNAYRGSGLVVITGLLARAGSTGYSLLAVSYATSFMDQRLIGLWLVAISLVVIMPLLDLGAGSALTNVAARAVAVDASENARTVISAGVAASFLTTVAVCSSVFGLLALARRFLHFGEGAILLDDDFYLALLGMLALSPFLVVSSTCTKVFTALEQMHLPNIINIVLSCASIVLLVVIKLLDYRCTVLGMTILTILPQCLLVVPGAVILSRLGFLSFKLSFIQVWIIGKKLAFTGSIFFFLQIGVIVGWGSDALLIGSIVGPEVVASFALPLRLLQTATMPVTMYNQPLWGTYALAKARNQSASIAALLKRSILTTAVSASLIASLVFIFLDPLISLWTKGAVDYKWSVGLLLVVWVVMDATGNCFSMYLNGCSVLRPQVFSVLTFCALSISMKFLLAPSFGVVGMVMSTIIAYLVSVPFVCLVIFRREVFSPLVVQQ